MQLIVRILLLICRISTNHPRLVMAFFLVLSVAGFATMPWITMSSDPLAGIGETNRLIRLAAENYEKFGEQDSLILVVEFPEPPGEERLPFIKELAETVEKLPDIRRVRYRFLDPDDSEQVALLFKHFLLGMNQRERQEIQRIFTPEGMSDAFRRTTNRLVLAASPYMQKRLLEDPLELGQFVSESMRKRVGSVSFGDLYLLIASPDSTLYLIQITPSFPSTDVARGKALIGRLHEVIPEKITSVLQTMPTLREKSKDLRWYITGKTAFHYESDIIFDRETMTILCFSFSMVLALLIVVYRSLWSGLLFMIPIAAGVGPNYGLIWLSYSDVNPVVMGASGVLFGLGTDYGVHLWGSLRQEIDQGTSPIEAVAKVYQHTGPPVMLGALVGILAFLCLCLSKQPAMNQFGYVGATGLFLTLLSTLFLFPALVQFTSERKRDYVPRMRVSFKIFSRLYEKHPARIVTVSAVVILVCLFSASRVSHEKDLFKVFLARDMSSMASSERISKKFQSNFSQPTLLSFEVDDVQQGLHVQRQLDGILAHLMERDDSIASFDSISYLLSPDSVRADNIKGLSDVVASWPELAERFREKVKDSTLSASSVETIGNSFNETGKILQSIENGAEVDQGALAEVERGWYLARINGKYRFLTQIRYSDRMTDIAELRKADDKILDAMKVLPVKVQISGPRQIMQEVLSTLISELVTLGLYVMIAVIVFFFALFGHPLGVFLSLIPMVGAFAITLGVMGFLGLGLPFSIVGVAPLIFGLGMDNGVHVVMGALQEVNASVSATMDRVTRPIIFTSLTNVLGFVAMLASKHYSLEFLGWAMVIGMGSAVTLTLTTLPALLLILEKRRKRLSTQVGQVGCVPGKC
ncbi:MAG: MMPL family transporter [Desulfomonile tiedjei]|nr:MMPL family transporter [Desulfomonile tiedjei]